MKFIDIKDNVETCLCVCLIDSFCTNTLNRTQPSVRDALLEPTSTELDPGGFARDVLAAAVHFTSQAKSYA